MKLFISLLAYQGLKQEHIEPAREHATMHVPYIDNEVQTWQWKMLALTMMLGIILYCISNFHCV